MSRHHLATICALACITLSSFGETPWYKDPGSPVTLRSAGFVAQVQLPRDWSVVDDAIVPPPALGPDCRVRVEFYRDREWDRFLISELASTVGGRREVLDINGHPAVSNQYVSDGDRITKFYINVSDLEPDSAAVWTARTNGGDCELQFLALVHTVRVTRATPPTSQ